MDEDEEISVTECKNLRGVTRAAILHAIKGGRLPARKIGEYYVIKKSDCMAYQGLSHSERGKRGAAARWSNKPTPTPPTPPPPPPDEGEDQ